MVVVLLVLLDVVLDVVLLVVELVVVLLVVELVVVLDVVLLVVELDVVELVVVLDVVLLVVELVVVVDVVEVVVPGQRKTQRLSACRCAVRNTPGPSRLWSGSALKNSISTSVPSLYFCAWYTPRAASRWTRTVPRANNQYWPLHWARAIASVLTPCSVSGPSRITNCSRWCAAQTRESGGSQPTRDRPTVC